MMDSTPLPPSVLQDFLLNAQVWLNTADECLQHLHLIVNDADACRCLDDTLANLAVRADSLGLIEVADYTFALRNLLAPVCCHGHLLPDVLPHVQACLDLLAWQLELVDPQTGRLNLDTSEQTQLLDALTSVLEQPPAQTCAPGHACSHPIATDQNNDHSTRRQ
ncbi:hypothetical protein J2W83_005094 [Pseudomonas hunanensis]|uniref:Uncharacterized protein n=1 Tax=Pseudomonas hunanensis TaxID=1247546 RepID=A0ACC6KAK0_9PSED|nr:hypothetical protein [Pseudomonas hunanensis]